MKRIGEHAVVIGASMAGLLAARVLAEAYERVTVVDRDELPTGPVPRQAVPQGRHAHTLLPLGQQQLEELLPGFPAELTAAGAPSYYLRRLRAVAATDPVVAGAFIAVVGMRERPPHVLRPAVAARVVRGPRPVEWSDRAERVRRRELCVGAVSTPLREAGPADAPEAVVLVHGNPGSSADWEPLLAALGARRRAVAWDAPGFGAASAPHGFTHTVDAHAAFVGRALDALGIERAHLVLHDFGGPWGLRWAAEQPDRFASAVLLGTASRPATAGTRSPGSGAPRCWARRSWPPRIRPASGCCCAAASRVRCRARSSTACTTTSTATPAAPCCGCTAPSPT
jgi:alpha/beta hydrolase fold